METAITHLSDVSREIEIITTAEELQPHFEEAYRSYRPKVEIRGFRKGKAPLELVRKLYGEMIEEEALPRLAGTFYAEAVKAQDLKPIGDPVITDMQYTRGERLRFKIRYDVRPTIVLKGYKGIKLEKTVHRVTDRGVEEELLRLRKINSTTAEAEQVTDAEYLVTAEAQELDPSGLPLVGRKKQDARFYLADPALEPPLRDALAHTTVGSQHTVRFEQQHGDHTHPVHLSLTVKKIERVVLPPLDDAFVAKITKEKVMTVDAFREQLRKDLAAYWEEKDRRRLVNDLVAEILRTHEFAVPESLVRSVLDGLLEDVRNQYPKRQLPEDFDEEKFYQENRAYAIFQAKWALLREEILKAEGITVSEDDLTALAEREAAKLGIDRERLVKYYQSSDQIKDRLLGDKLLDFLLKSANIKEVVKDDVPAA